MITQEGYSKDPGILPEGIAVTKARIEPAHDNPSTIRQFILAFEKTFERDEGEWIWRMKNKPQHDILYVYVIMLNRLAYRVQFAGWETGPFEIRRPNGSNDIVNWNAIRLSGPLVKCPFKRELKGFQGFRYTTKLF